MSISISLKRAVQSIIFLFMIVSVALVWPLRVIRPMRYEGSIDANSTAIMLNEGTIMQGFIPLIGELSAINIYIYNEETEQEEGGTLIFRLFDASLQEIENKSYAVNTLIVPGTCHILIESELTIGQVYYFTIENPNAELLFSMSDGVNLDTQYEYKAYFTKVQYMLCAMAVLFVGGILLLLVEFFWKKETCFVRIDFGLRVIIGILVTIASLWGLWNVFPQKKFTDSRTDILFYMTGILLFLGFALYSLFHKREVDKNARLSKEKLWKNVREVLQSVAFAGVMLGGIRYLNALYMQQQKLASNLTLACFAIAIICSYTKKEVLNWYNLVYLIPAVGCGISYLQQNKGDIENWEIYKGNVLCIILWGVVVLNTIRIVIVNRKCRSKVSLVYMIAFLLLVAEMVRSRNGRVWPIDIAVCWGLFTVRIIYKGKIQEYLQNFTNGVFIHFIGISIYAILYRPFHYYMHTRYPGVFHTVTLAAVHMVFVIVLAWIRYIEVYKRNRSIRRGWKELWIIGMAAAFLILTASRTGLFATLILCPAICIVTALVELKDNIIGIVKRMALLIITIVCFFPIIFTACRIVPAVVGKPFTYEIEWFSESIEPGEKWDSPRYITLAKFFQVAGNRISTGNEDSRDKPEMQDDTATDPTKVFMEIPEVVKTPEEIKAENWEEANQYSNGRLDIYYIYLEQLNWKGHETVSLMTEDGKETGHAHNVFLQVAHDFGIGAGIYFIVFCMFAGIRSIFYYFNNKEESTALIPLGILAVFGVCGMVEWVFLPYIPTGFGFLMVLVLLVPAAEKKERDKLGAVKEGQDETNNKHSTVI